MTTVSIWERMNRDELVVKASPDFVHRPREVFASDPSSHVSKQFDYLTFHLQPRDTYVLVSPSVVTCPFPDITEHASVQLTQE